jgi:4-amino-4-deoxy-L-arabinose transferase-like glycosyltransferase
LTHRLLPAIAGLRRFPAILFGLHLAIALIFTFAVHPLFADSTSGLDPDGYGAAGRQLYETGRFPHLDKPPLYPLLISAISAAAGGYHLPLIQVFQCLLSALACVVLYHVFRRTLENESAARFAALACAVFPLVVWYIPRLWTETLLLFLLAVWTLGLAQALAVPGWKTAAGLGVLTAILALAKGIGLAFIPLGALCLALLGGRSNWKGAALFVLTALACLAPWTYRNYRVSGAFIPAHLNLGLNLFMGNRFASNIAETPLSYETLYAAGLADIDAFLGESGPFDRRSPGHDRLLLAAALDEYPRLLPERPLVFAAAFWYLAGSPAKSVLMGALQLPLALLACLGWLRNRSDSGAQVLAVPVIGIYAAGILVFAFARLAMPVLPYLIGLSVKLLVRSATPGHRPAAAAGPPPAAFPSGPPHRTGPDGGPDR